MIAEAEIPKSKCVVQQIIQKNHLTLQLMTEIQLARPHKHNSLGILLLHEKGDPLGQPHQLVGRL